MVENEYIMSSSAGGSGHGSGRASVHATVWPLLPWVGWVNVRRNALEEFRKRGWVRYRAVDGPDVARAGWARELAIYVPHHVREMIRMDSTLERADMRERDGLHADSGASWQALRGLVRDPGGPWQLPDLAHLDYRAPAPAPPPHRFPARTPEPAWQVGVRVVTFFAFLVFMCRAIVACRLRPLPKPSGARSKEWPSADVAATSDRLQSDTEDGPSAPPAPPAPPTPPDGFLEVKLHVPLADRPPPYSQCTKLSVDLLPKAREQPPPPYSTCYVYFSDDDDEFPSVHFYNSRRQSFSDRSEHGHSSTEHDVNDAEKNVADNAETVGCDANGDNASRYLVFQKSNEAFENNSSSRHIERNSYEKNNQDNDNDLTVVVEADSEDISRGETLKFISA